MGIGIGIYTINSKEAVELYCKVFGLELGYHVLTEDGNYFHSELMKSGEPFLSVAEQNDLAVSKTEYCNPVELGYTANSEQELCDIFENLKKDGRVCMELCELPWSPLAAVVIDKFGVRWYITLPQHRPEE